MNCLTTPGADFLDVIYLDKSIYNSTLYSPIPFIVDSKSISRFIEFNLYLFVLDQVLFIFVFLLYSKIRRIKKNYENKKQLSTNIGKYMGSGKSCKEKICKENFQMCLLSFFIVTKLFLKSKSLLLFKLNQLMVPIGKNPAPGDHKSSLKSFLVKLFRQ